MLLPISYVDYVAMYSSSSLEFPSLAQDGGTRIDKVTPRSADLLWSPIWPYSELSRRKFHRLSDQLA